MKIIGLILIFGLALLLLGLKLKETKEEPKLSIGLIIVGLLFVIGCFCVALFV